MANQQHLDTLHQGVEIWNQWRQDHLDIEPDFSEANLSEANLEGANLSEALLKKTRLRGARLSKADLSRANLEEADLSRANLEEAGLTVAHLEKSNLSQVDLRGANLNRAYLGGANLMGATLEEAFLNGAHLEMANLIGAYLEGASLEEAHLEGACLSEAFFSNKTRLRGIILSSEQYGSVSLADIRWGGTNLAVVDWTSLKVLGDELKAHQMETVDGGRKYQAIQVDEYRTAVRANRQLTVVLRDQGMNEEADSFAYRAQILQRTVFRLQMFDEQLSFKRRIRMFFSWLFSWFLSLIAGYGYRPLNSIAVYLLLILLFAGSFYTLGHLRWYEAFVVSLTAFHGRGFFSQEYKPGDPQSFIAAIEAVVGLLIEISFIATFTQRFFGK